MLKIFGYGDKFRDQAVGGTRQDIELLAKDDYRTAWDMNRPLENIYEGVETLNDFMELFGKHILTDEGVFKESLHHEFSIADSNVVRVDLINRIPVVPTHTFKTYTTLAPGIAGVYHDASRQESMIIVHRPNVRLFERQISELLGLFYHDQKENVEVKYFEKSNTMKMIVKVRPHPSEEIITIEFGGDWEEGFDLGVSSIEMITEMYNDPTLNTRFVDAIGDDIELLMMEPMFEITQTGTHYWEINNGLVQLSQGVSVAEAFRVGKFDIDVIEDAIATDIVQEHRQYGESFRTDIHGEADNSVEINTLGGIEYNFAKGFKMISTGTGAEIIVDNDGNITINSAPNKDMSFGGVNILGITANVVNLTSVLNQDGTTTIDATGVGEHFDTDAETHNVTADTQNNIVTDKVDTITNEERIIGTKTEVIAETDTQTVIKKKTLNANLEYEIVSPKVAENITAKTQDSTTDVNTITTQTNNITTKNDTIGTKTKTVTGNETENITGNSTEIVTGNKSSTAQNQSITAMVDVVISSPNVTIGAEGGTITFLGDNQIVEGLTVQLEDNIIELNKNQTGIPASGLESGFEVNRGDSDNANILFREEDDTWGVGVRNDVKTIVRKESNNVSTNKGIPVYNTVSQMIETDSKFVHDNTTGQTTMNTNNATVVAPILTNSTKKVTNLNVDMVDGVHLVNTGAAADELAAWNGTTGIKTSNRKAADSVVADSNLPDGQAIINYFNSRMHMGSGTFNSNTGRVIPHAMASAPTSVQITQTSASGYVGEVWVTWDATNIKVFCSGNTTTATFTWNAFI